MGLNRTLIGKSGLLVDGGQGVRFEWLSEGIPVQAFAVRFLGSVHAYVNRCAHVGIPLDWDNGIFFDAAHLYLVCSTHGALYEPRSGQCVAGPCVGAALTPIRVEEVDGMVYATNQ